MASKHNETIAVVGLKSIGFPLSLWAAEQGYRVIGIDDDSDHIDMLAEYVNEMKARDIMKGHHPQTPRLSSDLKEIAFADIIIFSVLPDYNPHIQRPYLGSLRLASKIVGSRMKKGQTIIVDSQISEQVVVDTIIPALQFESGLLAGVHFAVKRLPEKAPMKFESVIAGTGGYAYEEHVIRHKATV